MEYESLTDERNAVAIVRRMWIDGIVAGQQYADVETVVRKAAVEGDADVVRSLVEGMVDDGDTPVVSPSPAVIAVEQDRDVVIAFFARHALELENVPWDLRDDVRDRLPDGERL